MKKTIMIETSARDQWIEITGQLEGVVQSSGMTDGLCVVSVLHTTAGITINENADPDVCADMISALDRLVPWEAGYKHGEGNSAAHLKASLMGASQVIPVRCGRLVLGTWQGVFLTEFDGPRTRNVDVFLQNGPKE